MQSRYLLPTRVYLLNCALCTGHLVFFLYSFNLKYDFYTRSYIAPYNRNGKIINDYIMAAIGRSMAVNFLKTRVIKREIISV